MKIDAGLFRRLATYPHAVVSWVGDDGYPVQTPASFRVDAEGGAVRIARTALPVPLDREVNVIVSHIRPRPGVGYDERRYIQLWGRAAADGDELVLRPARAWGWDEADVPFFEYSERSLKQARRYLGQLSAERQTEVKPRLSPFWTFLLATRLPFLTATIVPVLIGVAIAGKHGEFSWWLAALTVVAAAFVHIGLNVANDIFDTLSGADEANVNPTQFSGGSRVLQYGLVSMRQMIAISGIAYAIALSIGLFLVVYRESWELFAIGAVGTFISVFYTAPPFRLVHRGLGELTTALGFGPVMVLGAYVVQTQSLAWEPFVASVPVGILIALVLYVNEIPDRPADTSVGKLTLPARMSRIAVTQGYLIAVLAAFATLVVAASMGAIARPAIIGVVALPMALEVYRGVQERYDKPYELMATMGRGVQLHLVVGLLIFAGYVVSVVAGNLSDSPPAILT